MRNFSEIGLNRQVSRLAIIERQCLKILPSHRLKREATNHP